MAYKNYDGYFKPIMTLFYSEKDFCTWRDIFASYKYNMSLCYGLNVWHDVNDS